MAKQVIDIQAASGISSGQSTEHLRNYKVTDPDAKKFGYYDPSRAHLNFEVTRGGIVTPVNSNYSLDRRFRDNLRRRGIEDPNEKKKKSGKEPNRRTVANIILGGDRETMRQLAFGSQAVDFNRGADNSAVTREKNIELWAKDMYNFMARRFGEENIIGFVVHLDEKNPHIHCTLIPVNEKNKISWKSVFSGKNAIEGARIWRELHNDAAEVNKRWNLDRGDDIRLTGAKHKSSEEYWQELNRKCTELEQKNDNLKEAAAFLDKEIKRGEIRLRGLTTMTNNIIGQRDALMAESDQLRQQVADGKMTLEQQARRQSEIEDAIKELDAKLLDKQQKLTDADNLLGKLYQRRADLEDEINAMRMEKGRDLLPTIRDRELLKTKGALWEVTQRDWSFRQEKFEDFLDHLPEENRQEFERVTQNSFLMEIADIGTETVVIATALFLGYVDQATKFAASHGGGGSSPDSGWGRKDDEDEEFFRRRCLLMAQQMMKPGAGVSRSVKKKPQFRR